MRDPTYALAYWVAFHLKKLIHSDRLGEVPLFELYDWAAFLGSLYKKDPVEK